MKKNQKQMLALAILLASSPLYAASLNEVEANHPIQSAQSLTVNGGEVTISAAIGVPGATEIITTPRGSMTVPASTDDLDFVSFYARAGDVITIDVDNGIGGVQNVDTILAVFDSNKKVLRMNNVAATLDSGSASVDDARIDNFEVTATGVYYVGVSSYPRHFIDGGLVDTATGPAGDYNLVITGVSPSTQQISIDIKPGSRELAPINPKSKGKIPVALLSGNGFSAMDVKPASLTFGSTGNEASLSKCNSAGEDVNGDGLLDLVCHFENQAAAFKASDLEGVVRGSTKSGAAFEGRGYLKVLPVRTK